MNSKNSNNMKTSVWFTKYLCIAAFLALSPALQAQTFQKNRTLRETYRIGPNVEVQVINKYGDIHIVPWNKDSLVFEIDLTVTSNKQARVDKIFDYIDFSFKSTTHYVIAQTVFQGQNTFWNEMTDIAGTIFSSGTSTRIDYTVYYPAENDLKIENKFGNIYTTEHSGKVDISLSNGNMKAHTLKGPTRIKLDFGSASIEQITNAIISLGYAEFNLDRAGELNIDSRSSKLFIHTTDKIHLNSRRDRFNIKKTGEISGDLFFSSLTLDQVNTKINLKSNYGDIKVLGISGQFQRMDFSSQYSDITLYLDDEHLFDLDLRRDDKTQVVESAGIISKKEEAVEGLPKNFRAEIKAGKTGKPKVPVILNMKAGKLYLMKS